MGTSNYECYGDAVLRMFDLVSDGKFNEMMEIYWQIHPARTAYRAVNATYVAGAGILHRMVWKYQAGGVPPNTCVNRRGIPGGGNRNRSG